MRWSLWIRRENGFQLGQDPITYLWTLLLVAGNEFESLDDG